MKRLIIIDSNALLHRAFHALPPFRTKDGRDTGAVYGYLLILFKAIKDLNANYIVACFDTKAKTFRHEKFEQYKAQRPRTPDPIILQIPITKDVLGAMKIPVFAKDGFEADDLIATICKKVSEKDSDADVYILSGDFDNLQLVNEKIKLYTLGKGIKDTAVYDKQRTIERFGVTPEQMVDFKALTGDASDNVPGLEGVGKKTAAEILQKYGTLKNLYEELSTDTAVLKPKVKEALKNNKEAVFMSRELVETKNDVDIDFKFDDCKFGDFDLKEIENVLLGLEFNSLMPRIADLKIKN